MVHMTVTHEPYRWYNACFILTQYQYRSTLYIVNRKISYLLFESWCFIQTLIPVSTNFTHCVIQRLSERISVKRFSQLWFFAMDRHLDHHPVSESQRWGKTQSILVTFGSPAIKKQRQLYSTWHAHWPIMKTHQIAKLSTLKVYCIILNSTNLFFITLTWLPNF